MASYTNNDGRFLSENEDLRRLSVPPPKRCVAASKRKKNPDGSSVRCPNTPMPGQRVCHMHGGKAPNAIRDGQERVALQKAVSALRKLGEKVEPWERVDPREALLDVVHQAFTYKDALQFLINDLSEKDVDGIGKMMTIESGVEGVGAIQVPHAGGAKSVVRMKMFEAALDRCARISKMALDAGIEERYVKLAERQSEIVAEVIRASVVGLPEDMALQVITRAANELRFRSATPVGGRGSTEVVVSSNG